MLRYDKVDKLYYSHSFFFTYQGKKRLVTNSWNCLWIGLHITKEDKNLLKGKRVS